MSLSFIFVASNILHYLQCFRYNGLTHQEGWGPFLLSFQLTKVSVSCWKSCYILRIQTYFWSTHQKISLSRVAVQNSLMISYIIFIRTLYLSCYVCRKKLTLFVYYSYLLHIKFSLKTYKIILYKIYKIFWF